MGLDPEGFPAFDPCASPPVADARSSIALLQPVADADAFVLHLALAAWLLAAGTVAAQQQRAPFRWPEGFERSTTERQNISYDVRGATPSEVWASIREVGPRDSNNRRFAGWTQWHISWYVRYDQTGGNCRLAEAHVRTRITVTLPVWADRGNASPDLQASWDRFISALALHEDGHASRAIEKAAVIERGLTAVPPQPTCDAALTEGRAYFAAQMEELNKAQAEYDRTTSHGMTQGVVFPAGKPGGGRQ